MRLPGLLSMAAVMTFATAGNAAALPSPGNFLSEAIRDGRAEIELCNMALEKSQRPEVKEFARHMIQEQSDLNSKMEALAKRKGVPLPQGVSMTQKGRYELLSQTPQARFDKAFMDQNVSDHKVDVSNFSEAANEATDADIKGLAQETLPTLEKHLRIAEDLDARVKQ